MRPAVIAAAIVSLGWLIWRIATWPDCCPHADLGDDDTMSDCPIAYDHNDDLEECAVCGWTVASELAARRVPSEAELVREDFYRRNPWLRPPGSFAPSRPVVLCDRRGDDA